MIKPSLEEQKRHLIEGVSSCLVCGDSPISGTFTDYDGELKCHKCGMPYQTEGNKIKPTELERKYGLRPEEVAKVYTPYFVNVPILKRFWLETGKEIPLGIFDGSEAPFTEEEHVALWLFVWSIRSEISEQWADDFAWYNISVMAGEPLDMEA